MAYLEKLKELFAQRGAQARCSKGTGIAESLLSNYKNGKAEPSLLNAVLIADYFDVSLDWLAGREGFDRYSHKMPRSPALGPDEAGLVEDYRACTPRERGSLRDMASTMADRGQAKNNPDRADRAVSA